MGEQIIVLSGSSSPRVCQQAFLRFASIVEVRWEVIEESFYVWMGDDTRVSVRLIIDEFQLKTKVLGCRTKQRDDSLTLVQPFQLAPAVVPQQNLVTYFWAHVAPGARELVRAMER